MSIQKNTRFIFFGHGRSGSTLLGSYLSQHPDVHFDGEIYHGNRLKKLNPIRLFLVSFMPRIDWYLQQRAVCENVYGFSFLYYSLKVPRTSIKKMSKQGWKIIYLERDNDFDQMMSSEVAKIRYKWHRRTLDDEQETHQTFEVNKEKSLKRLKVILAEKKVELDILREAPHIKVNYEQDLAKASLHQKTLNKVFDYLGVSPKTLEIPEVQKTFKKPYSEIVSNYLEIKNAAIKDELI